MGFKVWPRPWQADAVAWLDRPMQGGFTREVVSHFLFLARRLGGPLHSLEGEAWSSQSPEGPSGALPPRCGPATCRVTLSGEVGATAKDDHNVWMLEGDRGAVRLCDWSVAERRRPDGTWQPAPDAMPNERARPQALKRQLEGVARLARGDAHHLATVEEAFNVQEIVEGILAGSPPAVNADRRSTRSRR